jgi:predicted SnoaL-like aldol condensation-catalyzing enzyme
MAGFGMKSVAAKVLAGLMCCAMGLGTGRATAETSAATRAWVERFVAQFYTRKDVKGAFEAFVVEDYIQHNPGLEDGRAAAQAALIPMFATSGAQFDVKHLLVDGDMALVHLFGRGDPKTLGAAVVDLYRLRAGRVVEHWDVIQPIAAGTDPLAGIAASPAGIAGPLTGMAAHSARGETRKNRAVMRHFVETLYRDKQVALAYQTFVSEDFAEHSPGRPAGRAAAIAALTPLFATPSASFTVEHLLVDGNLAAVHYRGRIDSQGPGAAVVEIFRLQDGKIVEHWDVYQPIPPISKNAHPMF